ncbi:AI-2E family transporter [Candidatus Saccharibacteria bacterium]|nr:AI-2E family transporter [Candidatus Saccharibacteria bacterium]
MSRQIIEVETKTFIRFWLVIFALVISGMFLYKIREALGIIGSAVLLAIAIRPLALKIDDFLSGQSPRKSSSKRSAKPAVISSDPPAPVASRKPTLSNILAYSIVLLFLLAAVITIGPILISEMSRFLKNLPDMASNASLEGLDNLFASLGLGDFSASLSSALENLSSSLLGSFGSNIFSSVSALSGIITTVVVTLIMTLFFLIEGPAMVDDFWDKVSSKTKSSSEIKRIVSKMAWVVSTFVDKKIVVAVVNGIASAVFIFILTIIFDANTALALPLGFIAMIFCIIPMFGQFIGGISITLILLLNNPFMALIWAVYYSIYSVIESNVFEPKIQGNALDLRPVIVLVAVTIGTYALGFFGTLISIPIAGCIKVLIDEYPNLRDLSEKR